MQNTVTLTRQEREIKGNWEVQVSCGREADLHRHLSTCDKNPGHQNFVPVDQFNVDHLPPGCHDNDLVDLVRAMSDLTVRVDVKYVIQTFSRIDKPYLGQKIQDQHVMRVATGWVCRIIKHDSKFNSYQSCSCQVCQNSPTPKNKFATIVILTAAHVVNDSLEAAHTTCHLFFDKGGTPDACSGIVTLHGMTTVWSDDVHDFCEMRYVTHDFGLSEKLDKMVEHWNNLGERFYEKYDQLHSGKQKSSPTEILPEALNKLTIIVSYPHGCSKQVSVGYCTDREEKDVNLVQYRYTTSTCPGSSGAHVIVVEGGRLWYWNKDIIHCGNCQGNKDLNFSSNTLF